MQLPESNISPLIVDLSGHLAKHKIGVDKSCHFESSYLACDLLAVLYDELEGQHPHVGRAVQVSQHQQVFKITRLK